MKKTIVLMLGLFFLVGCKSKETKDDKTTNETETIKKPNIVYILTDQWRGSALRYAGNPDVKTPNLDAFAKEAVNFTNVHHIVRHY